MTLDQIRTQIAEEAGLLAGNANVSQAMGAMIDRKIQLVLAEMDKLTQWRCAVEDFDATVPANDRRVMVASFPTLKIISCLAVVSGVQKELDYISLTEFESQSANYYGTTNSAPTNYSVGGNMLYVGPGNLAASTNITGKVQRRLTTNDVENLPEAMIVDGVLRRMLPKGTPGQIAAWNGWNTAKSGLGVQQKATAESRGKVLDAQIAANMNYLNSI
jgi:hypothetical protein